MLFQDLVNKTIEKDKPYIGFEFLREKVVLHHAGLGKVETWAINYPAPNGEAIWLLGEAQRTSGYDEEFFDAKIPFCSSLKTDKKELEYKLTKELCHAFDPKAARTDSRDKFKTLVKEIQNKPLEGTESPMYKSEPSKRWMAAILLCPKKFRDQFKPIYDQKDIEDYELAEIFKVPEWVMPWVMDDYFDEVYEIFMRS